MNNKYILSGAHGLIWPLGLPIGLIAALLLTLVYSYINIYNPIIYINFLVYLGMLWAMFYTLGLVMRVSKCRSQKAALIFGFIFGLMMVYTNWVSFLFVFYQRYELGTHFAFFVLDPRFVWESVKIIAEDGWYEMFGYQINGKVLWIIWTFEAVGLLAAGIMGGRVVLDGLVFCENCNQWTEDIGLKLRLSMNNREVIKEAISKDITSLINTPKTMSYPQLKVNIDHCFHCDNFSVVSFEKVNREFKRNEYVEVAEKFSDKYLLSKEDYEAFLERED